MAFEWSRMNRTAEGQMGKEQLRRRSEGETLEELAGSYAGQAQEILSGADSITARDEISRFAKKISSETGPEQFEYLSLLVHALNMRRPGIFATIPDDEHERGAFALALVRGYEKSLQ
jgi:hypothetical protein